MRACETLPMDSVCRIKLRPNWLIISIARGALPSCSVQRRMAGVWIAQTACKASLGRVFLTKLSNISIAFLCEQVYAVLMSADLLEHESWVLANNPTSQGLRTRMQLMDRLRASIITDLATFEASAMWAIEGYASVNAWVADHGRCTRGEANRLVKCSRLLRQLPVTAEAFRDGTLSAGQISVIAANLTSQTVVKFAEVETERVPLLAELDVNGTVMVMRTFAAHAQAELDDERDPEPEHDHLHFSPMLDNTFRLDGTLTGENAKTVEAGLDVCLPPLVEGEPVPPASQRYAEALVEMARRALQNVPVPARRSVDVTVLIDWQDYVNGGIARYADGTTLAPDRVRRLLCDAELTVIITGEHGEPLWMSRKVRSATPAQWRALIARDRHCAFPGCHRKPALCEAHHVAEYDRDHGPTDIDNMALLCSGHHKIVHKPGWTAKMDPGQHLVVTNPDGHVLRGPPRTQPYKPRT